MGKDGNLYYTVRNISIVEGGTHSCTGKIVSVIQSSYNPVTRIWYFTVLVERSSG